MKAYKATVKKTKNARLTNKWTFFANTIEDAKDYAERMTNKEFYGEGIVVKVEETNDPRNI